MGLVAWGYQFVWVEVGGSCPAAMWALSVKVGSTAACEACLQSLSLGWGAC